MSPTRERSTSRGPAPPRMLRVEYKGQPYDWFNLDEMGDIVRTSDFSNTLRENIAHYFGVPFDCQAVYDEEGMLSSVADFARALHSVRPCLRVHDIREMEMELKERTVQQLNEILADVGRSLRHFGVAPEGATPQHRGGASELPYDAPGRTMPQLSDAQSWPSPMTQRESPVSLADAVRSANEERAMSAGRSYGSQREGVGIATSGGNGNSVSSAGPGAGFYGLGLVPNGFSHTQAIGAGAPGPAAPGPANFGGAPVATWTGPAAYGQPNGSFMNAFGNPAGTSAPWANPAGLSAPWAASSAWANPLGAYPGGAVAQLGQPPVASGLGFPALPTGMHQQPSLGAPLSVSGARAPSMYGAQRQATPPPGSGTPPGPAFAGGSTPTVAAAWPGGSLNGMAAATLGRDSRSVSPAPTGVAGTARPGTPPMSDGGPSAPSSANTATQAHLEVETKTVGHPMNVTGSSAKPLMRQLDILLPEHQPQKAGTSIVGDASADPTSAGTAAFAGGDAEEAYDVIEVSISKDAAAAGGERAQRFGFANVPTRDARALLVSWVDQHGLLARWNRTFPEKAISEGDRIVIVNTASDDVEAMRAELQTDTIHMLVHRRSSAAC